MPPPRTTIGPFSIACGKFFKKKTSSSVAVVAGDEKKKQSLNDENKRKRKQRSYADTSSSSSSDDDDEEDDAMEDGSGDDEDDEDTSGGKKEKSLKFVSVTGQPKRKKTFWEQKQENDLIKFFSRVKIPLEAPRPPPPSAAASVAAIASGGGGDFKQVSEDSKGKALLFYDLFASPRYLSFEKQDPDGKLGLVNRRQRTDWWLKQRGGCPTGSRLVNACAMFGFDQLMECWYEVYDSENPLLKQRKALHDPRQVEKMNEMMAWGTYHEVDGLATFLYHMGESLDLQVRETTITTVRLPAELLNVVKNALKTQFAHEWRKDVDDEIWNDHFLKDSPDGIGRNLKTGRKFVLEIKGPYGLRDPAPYDKMKYYYWGQVQLHMLTEPDLDYGYLLSWSPTVTRVWLIEKDVHFWHLTLPLLVWFHQHGRNKKPPKDVWSEASVNQMTNWCKKKAESAKLVGEFPSVWSCHRGDELEKLASPSSSPAPPSAPPPPAAATATATSTASVSTANASGNTPAIAPPLPSTVSPSAFAVATGTATLVSSSSSF